MNSWLSVSSKCDITSALTLGFFVPAIIKCSSAVIGISLLYGAMSGYTWSTILDNEAKDGGFIGDVASNTLETLETLKSS